MPTDDDAPPPAEPTPDEPSNPRSHREREPHDTLSEGIRARLESLVPELVKKTMKAGMGAVFSTEEGIRKFAREVNVGDAVGGVAGYIADSADGAKDKVFEVIARETREFLANMNVGEEIAKLLTTLSFEIKTEIRFIPNSERMMGSEPDVKASVRLKRNDRPDPPPPEEKAEKKDDEKKDRMRFWRRDGDRDGTPASPEDDEDDSHDK